MRSSTRTRPSGGTLGAVLDRLRSHSVAGFGDGAMVLRAGVAAALSWWIAADLLHSPSPDLAPAGAILVAQLTPYATARKALQRASGVGFGLVLGAVTAAAVGTNLLGVLIVVLLGMYAGRLLRLGPQTHQIALTGVLVMGASAHLGYGAVRLEDNIVGVLIGTAVGLLLPAPGFTHRAGEELARLTQEMSALLAEMADHLRTGDWAARAGDWVEHARVLSKELDTVRGSVRQAEDAIRWRPRSAAARPRIERLAEATRGLDHVGHQVRGIARGLYNLTFREGRPPALHWSQKHTSLVPEAADAPDGLDRVLADLGAMLAEMAAVHTLSAPPGPQLRAALWARLGEAETSFLTTALGQSPAYAQWRVLCTAGILEDARKMLHELDPDLGPHQGAFKE